MPANSVYYSMPYVGIVFILLFLFANEQGYVRLFTKKSSIKLSLIIILVFIGLRGFVFTDWLNYYPWFEHSPRLSELKLSTLYGGKYELGFILYTSLIKTIYPNYFFWIFVNTLFDLVVFYLVFKRYSHSIILSFLVFFVFNGLGIELNLYRNSKGLILFLLSIPYLRQRKITPYMFLNFAGACFHSSSLLYIPLYFILNKELPRIFVWGVFIFTNVVFLGELHITSFVFEKLNSLIRIPFVEEKTSSYIMSAESYGLSLGYLERTFAFLLFTFQYKRLVAVNDANRIFYNSFLFYYMAFYLFADVATFTQRIPLLFVYSYWLLYPNILGCLKRQFAKLLLSFIICLSFAKIVTGTSNVFMYYDNVLFGVKTYAERSRIFYQNASKLMHK